ncbi:MAG: HAD family hydrolase [Acidobacteria bacterium]|nr:HAD family hydrolase [Acidobacteriota bacterium]
MLKAIAFDLWETLITDLPEIAQRQETARIEGLASLLAARDLVADRVQVTKAHRDTWHRCWALYWSNDRDVSARGQVCHFLEAAGIDPANFDDAELRLFEDAYGRPALDYPPALVDGALRVVEEARAMGLAVGVISNTGRTPGWALRRLLHDLGLGSSIDAMVFSNEHGECKPRRSIFERLRGDLGCAFNEMMFVGDNLFADVWGAQQCGMEAVHFAPPSRGNAVGEPTHEEWELRPHTTVSRLDELINLLRKNAP